MDRHTEFMDGNTQQSKHINFLKLMYKFNAIIIKI